jgi:hypothetical protein
MIAGAMIGASIVGATWIDVARSDNAKGVVMSDNTQTEYILNLQGAATQFGEACVPKDTGGGVTQCANPTMFDSAIVACFDNIEAYRGANIEDTFHLLHQCVFDWVEAHTKTG